LLHAGYVLLIVSMMVTRLNWLRILAVGSGTLEAVYYSRNAGLASAFWESLFVLTNVTQLAIMMYRNQMARFSADERAFHEIAVPSLDPAKARRLLHAGHWVEAAPGAVLAREGEVVPDLAFLVAGDVEIRVGEQIVGHCGPGSFVGEISVSTGGPATATAVAKTPIRYLAFERGFLRRLLDGSNDIGRAVELAFRHGLRDKLMRTNQAMVAIGQPGTP
jgi:CRP-like cAMP-binding protein